MGLWFQRARRVLCGVLVPLAPALAQTQDGAAQELLRQQERERVLREREESAPDVRLRPLPAPPPERLPANESPCLRISRIQLDGEQAQRFTWALRAADPKHDAATGRCLGTVGINVVMARIQNAIVARGFVTTRVLAAPQDLNTGTLTLTVVPGRIRAIRFATHTSLKATAWNAVPAKPGDLLNLRDIEQALENFKRVPTVEADIQIVPADGDDACPGESDLVIAWRQRSPPIRFSASLDDAGSKATGKLQGGATLSLDDLLMWNDLLYANVNHDVFNANSKGTKSYTAHYSVPYGYWTLSATASGYEYRQTVAGYSQNYVYSGTSDNAELRLSRLVYRDATRKTGDTNLRGAVAGGKQVAADIGGNLNIESLQDTSTFKSKDTNVNGSVTAGAGFAASANVGKQTIDSDFASITEQARIEAGDGGFQIKVKGNTNLKGAAITSSEQAVQDSLNTLTTGTLAISDIKNRAKHKASSVSIGGGHSAGKGGMKETGRYGDGPGTGGGVGTNQQGQAATGGQVPGTTLPTHGNLSATTPIVMGASGKRSSTTRSGISGANITIADAARQQAVSGKSVDDMMAELNRDVFTGKDSANALKPIFNEEEIKTGFEIVGALQRETGALLNNLAKKADAKQSEARAAEAMAADLGNGLTDAQRQALRDQAAASHAEARNIDASWGAGGAYRQIAAALATAAGGNVTGTTSQFAQNMLINHLQQQGAGYLGKLVANGTLTEGTPLHAAMHAIVACGGAAASQQSCGSAALGAAASSLLTRLFSDTRPDETATEREAKRNLIVSIVTGIGTAGGVDAAAASTGAATAVDNNWLASQQVVQMNKELKASDGMLEYVKIQGKWAFLSGKQDVVTAAGVGKGLALAGWDDVTGMAAFLSDPVTGLKGLKDLITDPEVRGQLSDSLVAEFDAQITRMQTALKVGGTEHANQLGEDLGNLVWRVGSVVTGAGGAAKAGVTLAKVGINVSSDALVLMARKTPSLITGVAADAARTFRFTDDMLPALTTLKRNDGRLGETFSAQLMKEATGKDFVPIQNASGHGADLVYIDHATKTIYHVEVKTNVVGQAGGIPEKLERRFKDWIDEASGGSLNRQRLPPHMTEMAAEILRLRDTNKYQVSHNLMQVEITNVKRTGKVSATLRPWAPSP